ncbi:conserved hypothetical protein [Talaromyces stipitatus ATCC 10500]|uniref:Uncharacterized protein n=1 Tax=Talaromyces stipitatus (strain ATCC 10500 / CBS 375.48 / QM 6759 / NRRL 1006) TaxID=441959 RepID=B8MVK1_TALSN|nr:uncharacterized protein TSTA_080490 [Talaromyces stipitatus ATCC 10500]EED11438.1 conserved hypothetical protein [Talaromyces stipitatus ATCC 10500]
MRLHVPNGIKIEHVEIKRNTDFEGSLLGKFVKMCFYDQKIFACGDWKWTQFAHQCSYENRTGETCGLKMINMARYDSNDCRICKKIQTKIRRRQRELQRLQRWSREGRGLVATINRSQLLVSDLEEEISQLQKRRYYSIRKKCSSGSKEISASTKLKRTGHHVKRDTELGF